ncbi:hypothetical protein AAC387_Pa06g0043 [Persea americana]
MRAENSNKPILGFPAYPNAHSTPPHDPMSDYEVAELTWENGQLVMHGFGFPRTLSKPSSSSPIKSDWENPLVGGTLECIVDQATCPPPPDAGADDHFTWFHHHCTPADAAIDMLVPCSTRPTDAGTAKNSSRVPGPPLVASSTMVGSCSGAGFELDRIEEEASAAAKHMSGAAPASNEISSIHMIQSSTYGSESRGHVETETTWDMDLDVDFTSTSHEYSSLLGMPMPLSSHSKPTTVHGHDSVCHTKPQRDEGKNGCEKEEKAKMEKSTVSTKRSRAATVHNQSERQRRDKINQRMKTLQKLVPNSSKMDKASVLDEVIEYLKQLQTQVRMMSSFPHMMMPMTTMRQLQMSMMAQMGMGAMDSNSINRLGPAASVPPLVHHPATLLPLTVPWDGSVVRLHPSATGVLPDAFSTFFDCQTMPHPPQQQQQPISLDAYNRMTALYKQAQQPTPPGGK